MYFNREQTDSEIIRDNILELEKAVIINKIISSCMHYYSFIYSQEADVWKVLIEQMWSITSKVMLYSVFFDKDWHTILFEEDSSSHWTWYSEFAIITVISSIWEDSRCLVQDMIGVAVVAVTSFGPSVTLTLTTAMIVSIE